jgi:Leucine-rich repeat (LRR) protein
MSGYHDPGIRQTFACVLLSMFSALASCAPADPPRAKLSAGSAAVENVSTPARTSSNPVADFEPLLSKARAKLPGKSDEEIIKHFRSKVLNDRSTEQDPAKWFTARLTRAYQQKMAADKIVKANGSLQYDDKTYRCSRFPDPNSKPLGWECQLLGVDFFANVVWVDHDPSWESGWSLASDNLAHAAAQLPADCYPNLDLHLSYCRVTNAGLKYLLPLKNLEMLSVESDDSITDAGLETIAKLTRLRKLVLSHGKFTDKGMETINGMPRLEELELWGTEISDDGLAPLSKLATLRALNLWDTKTTDNGLAHLRTLTSLQKLNLTETKITNAGLVYLKELANLEDLTLYLTDINDAGLLHLLYLKKLRRLDLRDTKVTAFGLERLKELKSLRTLDINDNLASQELKKKLAATMPNCKVNAN